MERLAVLLVQFGVIVVLAIVGIGMLALVSPFFSWLAP